MLDGGREALLARRYLSVLKLTFNFSRVGERGVYIGDPKRLPVTPYRGKSIC